MVLAPMIPIYQDQCRTPICPGNVVNIKAFPVQIVEEIYDDNLNR